MAPTLRTRFPAPPHRLVAVGDLHGDFGAAQRVLKLAGLIDGSDEWSGDDTVLVQTGDVLDRGDGERAIIELLEHIQKQAAKAGGFSICSTAITAPRTWRATFATSRLAASRTPRRVPPPSTTIPH